MISKFLAEKTSIAVSSRINPAQYIYTQILASDNSDDFHGVVNKDICF